MTPDEASFVSDLRMKVLANQQKGLPAWTGMDREALQKAIDICRADYTAAQSKSKASGVSSPSGAKGPLDLAALFTDKPSNPKA